MNESISSANKSRYQQSALEFKRALQLIPGGVNSPVRAFKSIGGNPVFMKKASGSQLIDADDNTYIDYCLSWGVSILGHANPKVIEKATTAMLNGTSFGTATASETDLAERIIRSVPSIEKVRMVNSGTEAVMSAIRLARGFTGRNIIVKFDGCYHGHSDMLLVSAGSGVAEIATASSQGIPADMIQSTISLPFNNAEAITTCFKKLGSQIAAVILEPLPANMGLVLPKPGFLKLIRELTEQNGSLLIFDEVISGFRNTLGGAQAVNGIKPDITTLGKIIGGGFPVGAYGGRKEIMDCIAPAGNVYQAGTLSGNPVAMAAGIETLNQLAEKDFYHQLNQKAENFISTLRNIALKNGLWLNAEGSMFTLFFTNKPPIEFNDVKQCNQQRFAKYYRSLLDKGVYLSPSQYETNFISASHTTRQLDETLEKIEETLLQI